MLCIPINNPHKFIKISEINLEILHTYNYVYLIMCLDVEWTMLGWYEISAVSAGTLIGPRHHGPMQSHVAVFGGLGGIDKGNQRRQSHCQEARRRCHEGLRDA